jgi:prefoldin subunit 5
MQYVPQVEQLQQQAEGLRETIARTRALSAELKDLRGAEKLSRQ